MSCTIKESSADHNYVLSDGFYCEHPSGTIKIGGVFTLTPDEEIKYTTDALTHEHIHKILFTLFDLTTTQLFDAIGDKLRNKALLRRKIKSQLNECPYIGSITLWSDSVKRYGIEYLYETYYITLHDVDIMNEVCNHRH